MNLKWNPPAILAYYEESRKCENSAFNQAIADYRKSSFFNPRHECSKRRIMRIAIHRVMLTNYLLRHLDEVGATAEQISGIENDSEAFYNWLTAFAGTSKQTVTLNAKKAWAYYIQKRDEKMHQLEYHMEEVYSSSWWARSHVERAMQYIPEMLKLCAFLLQYADQAMLTAEQHSMLLNDEETYYAYMVRLIREL